MSEANNLIPLEVIPPDSIMSVEITTDLYIRLQQLLLEGLVYKDLTEFQTILKDVKDNKATEGLAYHVHTLLFLINLIEKSARNSKIVQKKNFDTQSAKVLET